MPRSGNVVLFVPSSQSTSIEAGMILTVWRIGQKKKVAVAPCSVDACYAFRVVQLEPVKDCDWETKQEHT